MPCSCSWTLRCPWCSATRLCFFWLRLLRLDALAAAGLLLVLALAADCVAEAGGSSVVGWLVAVYPAPKDNASKTETETENGDSIYLSCFLRPVIEAQH